MNKDEQVERLYQICKDRGLFQKFRYGCTDGHRDCLMVKKVIEIVLDSMPENE